MKYLNVKASQNKKVIDIEKKISYMPPPPLNTPSRVTINLINNNLSYKNL